MNLTLNLEGMTVSVHTCLSLDMASEEMNSFLLNRETKHKVKGLFLVNPSSSSQRT